MNLNHTRRIANNMIYLCLVGFLYLPIFLFFAFTPEQKTPTRYQLPRTSLILVCVFFVLNIICFAIYLWGQHEINKVTLNLNLYIKYLRKIKIYYAISFVVNAVVISWFIIEKIEVTQAQLYIGASALLGIELLLCFLLLHKIIVKTTIIYNVLNDDDMLVTKLAIVDNFLRQKRHHRRHHRAVIRHLQKQQFVTANYRKSFPKVAYAEVTKLPRNFSAKSTTFWLSDYANKDIKKLAWSEKLIIYIYFFKQKHVNKSTQCKKKTVMVN